MTTFNSVNIYQSNDQYEAFGSNDLALIDPTSVGLLFPVGRLSVGGKKVLMCLPLTDEEGNIAESTSLPVLGQFHITYSLTENNLWNIDTPNAKSLMPAAGGDDANYFNDQISKARAFFHSHGELKPKLDPSKSSPVSLIRLEPAVSARENWVGYIQKFYKTDTEDYQTAKGPKKVIKIFDTEGNLFEPLALIESHHYVSERSAGIFYFYEPKNKRVLAIADYT
jgi:hypothetical protein